MTKRFVSWAAVSSLPQAKKVSLEDQLKTNRQHIDRWGGVLVEELVVPGESRNIVLFEEACCRVEAYARLKELIERRTFDVLIYLDRGRLGRKASMSMAVVELCHEAGVATYETENPPQSLDGGRTYDDLIVGAVKSIGYQREVEKMQMRRRMGMADRVKRGHFPAAVPYGWKVRYDEDGTQTIVVNEEAAAVIRLMLVDLYLGRGLGAPSVLEELDRRGVPTPRGGRWRDTNFGGFLDMVSRYAGWTELNVRSKLPYIRARGNWPAILTDAEADAIVADRKRRARAKRSVNSGYMFSGVVWCRTCNRVMSLETTTKPAANRLYPYARCRRCTQPKKVVRLATVHAAVTAAIEYLLNEANLKEVLDVTPSGEERLLAELAERMADLKRLNAGRERADNAYVSGFMDADRYHRQLARLQTQIREQEAEIERLQARLEEERLNAQRPERLREVADQRLAMLTHLDPNAANAWLHRHVRVWVDNGAVVGVEYL